MSIACAWQLTVEHSLLFSASIVIRQRERERHFIVQPQRILFQDTSLDSILNLLKEISIFGRL